MRIAKIDGSSLRAYMNPSDSSKFDRLDSTGKKIGSLPTTHENCRQLTGRARPGKTARDRAGLSK